MRDDEKQKRPHRIELDLRDIRQLFNSMDPSPFHEKDLDADAEEFMVGWAQEFPLREPVALVVHLRRRPEAGDTAATIQKAVQHYFSYKADLNKLELRRLLEQGRISLVIGLVFLSGCLFVGSLLAGQEETPAKIMREGLVIAGWVAMWRPMQIYLYDWWPLARRGRIFDKMSRMKVEVVFRSEKSAAQAA
jgi:hypothetical protein